MSTQIKYKDKIITAFDKGTITLHTIGDKLSGDIEIMSTGECDGNHIIEVDTLPTENINENDLYKCGGAYYQYEKEFKDALVVGGGTALSFVDALTNQGITVELYYVNTKPTENIRVLSEADMLAPFYYVVDENDIFYYEDGQWFSMSSEMGFTNGGAITDASEATEEGYGYALVSNGWKILGAPYYTGEVVIE